MPSQEVLGLYEAYGLIRYSPPHNNPTAYSIDPSWSSTQCDEWVRSILQTGIPSPLFDYLDARYGKLTGPSRNTLHWAILTRSRNALQVCTIPKALTGADLIRCIYTPSHAQGSRTRQSMLLLGMT